MNYAPLTTLKTRLDNGSLNCAELTDHYLRRIERYDEPLRSVIEIHPRARELAAELDRVDTAQRGPLHGLPLLIKDNIDTAAPLHTSAGSLALADFSPPADAFLVQRLRDAGALILGKTNLSEWANFRGERSSSGWSSRRGQCRNPYAPERTPRGSSAGSGASLAADFCAASIGTETDGSIVSPASANSVVGLKPTVGRISRAGVVPISHSQDTAGPMTRSVADAALLLQVLAAADPADPASRDAPAAPDYLSALGDGRLDGVRIGVLRGEFGRQRRVDRITDGALDTLRGLGAVLIEGLFFDGADALRDAELSVMRHEFKHGLNRYFADRPDCPLRSLAALIAYNDEHADSVLRYFGQELAEQSQALRDLEHSPDYWRALATCRRLTREQGIDRLLDRHSLDALVAPTAGLPWMIDLANGDHRTGSCAQFPAVAGYPHLTVPSGYAFGLPVALSVIAGAWREAEVLKIGFAFEQAAQVWRPPDDAYKAYGG